MLESGGGEARAGGDIFTERKFAAFELRLEFRLAQGANSGIKYYVDPEINQGPGYSIGLEYQLLDDARLFAHGQGYDLVERPAIRDDDPMKLQARMNITVHPIIGSDRVWVWVCDNYLITETGIQSLHTSPQQIFEV